MGDTAAPLRPSPPHRVLLAVLAVCVPVVVGVGATLAQWHPPQPLAEASIPTPAFTAPIAELVHQNLLVDGTVLVPWPLTGAPIEMHVGQTLELALAPLPGESVRVLEPKTLATVRVPVCNAAPVCSLRDVTRWAFEARSVGIAHVHIDYGLRCRPMLCGNTPTSVIVTVLR